MAFRVQGAPMTLLCEIKKEHLIKIVDFLCSVMPPSYLGHIVGGQAREARAREPRKNPTTKDESYKSRRFLLFITMALTNVVN
jgi:hypothetical protein